MEEKQDGKSKNTQSKRDIINFVKSVAVILLVIIFIRAFLAQAFNIPSGSMKPTLLVGDFILVNKLVYGDWSLDLFFSKIGSYKNRLTTPDRGDVIVFKYPENPKIDFIKRVIGLPGDVVEVKNDIVYINGKPLRREYIGKFKENDSYTSMYYEYIPRKDGTVHKYTVMEIIEGEGKDFGPIKVPKGHYFVLGDNRDNSRDSRFWGFVPDDYIIGEAFVIYFSIDPNKSIFGIRFDRIGKVIQ
ncbi:MAG: signal peptidase I [Persephonella sp.]|nr:MAG: signal peptidase I [Persephonella sp.]